MPIFEYKCNKCGHVMEFLEKSAKPAKHNCQKCASGDLKKLLSAFAVGRSQSPAPQCESCPTSSTCDTAGACGTGGCPFS